MNNETVYTAMSRKWKRIRIEEQWLDDVVPFAPLPPVLGQSLHCAVCLFAFYYYMGSADFHLCS